MNTRTLMPLLRATAHAVTWWPVVIGATFGTAVLLLPDALSTKLAVAHLTTLARIAAVCVALGTAFLLDDPAAGSTPTVPTSRLARHLVRITLAIPALALWWMLTLGLTRTSGHHTAAAAQLPVGALTLEAATLLAATLAVAAIAQRRTVDGNTGVIAAPGILLLTAVTWFLPRPIALVLAPTDPRWAASHCRWIAVLASALLAFLWAGTERGGRPARATDRAA